jgi:hypothetical protein
MKSVTYTFIGFCCIFFLNNVNLYQGERANEYDEKSDGPIDV